MPVLVQKTVKWFVLSLSISLFIACAGTPEPTKSTPVADTGMESSPVMKNPAKSSAWLALEAARKMLGVSYRYGGTDPRGFDCSGLIQYSFSHAGIKLPRTSQDIFRISQLISPKEIQPGDLVFFAISKNKISHVGIYDAHNRFIHAPSSGKGVSYAELESPYWRQHLVAVGRI